MQTLSLSLSLFLPQTPTLILSLSLSLSLSGKNAIELEERMKTGKIASEQDFSVDPYEPHPDFRFSKGAIMSENEWIDLSDNMEKTDGYVKRDAQAMKDRPGEENLYLHLCQFFCSVYFFSLLFSLSLCFLC